MRAAVIDSFNVTDRVAVEYGSHGVIVISNQFGDEEPPMAGDRVLIVKPDGWIRTALIGEIKLSNNAPGFLSKRTRKNEMCQLETRLWWGKDISAGFIDTVVLASVG